MKKVRYLTFVLAFLESVFGSLVTCKKLYNPDFLNTYFYRVLVLCAIKVTLMLFTR